MILTRGDDATRVVTVRDRVTLDPVDITGAVLRFSCRAMLGAPATIISKSTEGLDPKIVVDPDQAEPDSGDLHHRGEATITFGRADFLEATGPVIYVWDLEVEQDGIVTTVLSGRMLVQFDVTHEDDEVTPEPEPETAILTRTVNISAAQLRAMGEVDNERVGVIELIPGPGAGKFLLIRRVQWYYFAGDSPYGGLWDSSVTVGPEVGFGEGAQSVSIDARPDGLRADAFRSSTSVSTDGTIPDLEDQPLIYAMELD